MKYHKKSGSTFIVVLILVVVLTALVGAAYEYTTTLQRNTQRSVVMLEAQAIGNAAIEVQYAQWKQIYASQQTQVLTGTSFNSINNLENASISGGVFLRGTTNTLMATSTNYWPGGWTITNYGIVAADYNFAPLSSSGTPSRCYDVQPPSGYTTNPTTMNNGASFYYIATADVSMPIVSGTMTVRTRRIFRKQYVNPFQYAIYYNDPLEINPGATFNVTGKVFTNQELWIDSNLANFHSSVSYGGVGYYTADLDYINGTPSPNIAHTGSDARYVSGTGTGIATFSAGPPTQQNTQTLYGVGSSDPTNGNPNNIYHDLIDPPPGVLGMTGTASGYSIGALWMTGSAVGYSDPFDNSAAYSIDPVHNPQNFRFYNNADVVVYTNTSGVMFVSSSNGTATPLGSGTFSVTYPPTSGTTPLTATVTGSSISYSGTTASSIPYNNSTASLVNAALVYSALLGGTLTVTGTLPGYPTVTGTNVIKFTTTTGTAGTTGTAAIATSGTTITDNRQGGTVNLTVINVGNLAANLKAIAPIISNTTDIVYLRDARNGTVTYNQYSAVTGTTGSVASMNAYKLTGGSYISLPALTIASNNPVYVQGDFNTNGSPPSNTSTTGTSFNSTAQTDQFAYKSVSGSAAAVTSTNTNYTTGSPPSVAIVADAISVLSGTWTDSNSSSNLSSRIPTATTINAAFMSGQVPTVNNNYSGGVENFPRFLESWSSSSSSIPFTYVGSMVELFKSNQAYKPWPGTGNNYYNPPNRVWSFNMNFEGSPPPGFNSSIIFQRYKWESYLIKGQ